MVPVWAKEGRKDSRQRYWTEGGTITDAFSTEGTSKDKQRKHLVLSFMTELDNATGSGNQGKKLRCDLRLSQEERNVPEGEQRMHEFSLSRLAGLMKAAQIEGDMEDGDVSEELLMVMFPKGSNFPPKDVSPIVGTAVCIDIKHGPDKFMRSGVRTEVIGVGPSWGKK